MSSSRHMDSPNKLSLINLQPSTLVNYAVDYIAVDCCRLCCRLRCRRSCCRFLWQIKQPQ